MAKPPKTQSPTTKMTARQRIKLNNIKAQNKMQGVVDASDGRDTKMSRDGGTNRRLQS